MAVRVDAFDINNCGKILFSLSVYYSWLHLDRSLRINVDFYPVFFTLP